MNITEEHSHFDTSVEDLGITYLTVSFAHTSRRNGAPPKLHKMTINDHHCVLR